MTDTPILTDEDITTSWMRAGGQTPQSQLNGDPDGTDGDGSDGADGDTSDGADTDGTDSDTQDA